MLIESFGVISAVLFGIATLVQAYKSFVDGHSDGISHAFIWMLIVGFTLMTIYVIETVGWDLILIGNHVSQAVLWLVIAKYKYWRRNAKM